MVLDFLHGIPGIGHGLAALSFACGRTDEAKKALHAANRSTLVIAGGVGGAVLGGPVGMVTGAVAAGTAHDTLSSVAHGRPEGVIRGVVGVANDLDNGRVPLTSTLVTGLYITGDVLSGITGGTIASQIPQGLAIGAVQSMAKETGIEISKEALKEIVKTGSQNALCSATSHTLADKIDDGVSDKSSSRSNNSTGNSSANERSKSYSQSNSRNRSQENCNSSGGGEQPPQNNKNFKSDHERDLNASESHFEVFCKLFGENITSLNDINIAGVYIFREITSGLPSDRGRKNSLKRLIISLRSSDIMKRVIEAVKRIFTKMDRSDVNFQNFLCLSEMVATYVSENLARRGEMQTMNNTLFHVSRSLNQFFLLGESRSILSIFYELRGRISRRMSLINPTFGNIMTAVTHYYKHKFVPARERILSVREYFALISRLLSRVQRSTQYDELVRGTRRRLVYDVYQAEFGRRVRLVLQMQNGKVVVSSCHILDVIVRFDEDDGDEEFDPSY